MTDLSGKLRNEVPERVKRTTIFLIFVCRIFPEGEICDNIGTVLFSNKTFSELQRFFDLNYLIAAKADKCRWFSFFLTVF